MGKPASARQVATSSPLTKPSEGSLEFRIEALEAEVKSLKANVGTLDARTAFSQVGWTQLPRLFKCLSCASMYWQDSAPTECQAHCVTPKIVEVGAQAMTKTGAE